MSSFQALVLALLAALASACGNQTGATPTDTPPASVDPATASTITGRVQFDGVVPAAETLRIDGDRQCVTLNGRDTIPAERIVLGGDGRALANAFVYVSSGLEAHLFRAPAEPVVLDQQRCRYVPRVVGVMVGQPLEVRNSDPLLHNVRADATVNQPFNMGQPVQGIAFTRTFATREVMVPLTCDVHAWMNAYIGVLEHPFHAVSGPDGTFTLSDLPPGTYTIEAWHETLGTRSETLTLGPRDTKDVVFTFAG